MRNLEDDTTPTKKGTRWGRSIVDDPHDRRRFMRTAAAAAPALAGPPARSGETGPGRERALAESSRLSPHASAQSPEPRGARPSGPAPQDQVGLLHVCVEVVSAEGSLVVLLHGWLGIDDAILGGFEWGSRTVNVMAAFWPERCLAIVAMSGYLAVYVQLNRTPLPPTPAVPDVDRLAR